MAFYDDSRFRLERYAMGKEGPKGLALMLVLASSRGVWDRDNRVYAKRTIVKKGSKTRARRSFERGILFALALSTWSRQAASQVPEVSSPLALDWSAPAGCPTREHVIERVTAILGRSTKPHGALAVRAIATRLPSGQWRVNLAEDREGGAGSQEFEAESCDAAADATALIVSLMIDPTITPGARDVDPSHEPEKTAPPPVPPPSPPPPQPRPPEPPPPTVAAARLPERTPPSVAPARPHLFAVRASLAGDVGTFSRANVGGELLLAVTPWRLRFELAGSYWVSSMATLAGSPSEGAWLELATLGVRAAYVLSAGDVGLAPLVGIEGDRMSATGFGGTSQHHQTANHIGVDLGATGIWFPVQAFHALALSLTLEAVSATEKPPPFVATEPGGTERVVQQSSQVALRAFLGAEVRFF